MHEMCQVCVISDIYTTNTSLNNSISVLGDFEEKELT